MGSILVVESYLSLGSLYREVLEEEGYRVFVAQRGKEALTLASHQHFGVAIVEEEIPDIKPEELLKKLKKLQPHMQGTICTVTDFWGQAQTDLCDESVLKTPDFTALQQKIEALLKKSSSSVPDSKGH